MGRCKSGSTKTHCWIKLGLKTVCSLWKGDIRPLLPVYKSNTKVYHLVRSQWKKRLLLKIETKMEPNWVIRSKNYGKYSNTEYYKYFRWLGWYKRKNGNHNKRCLFEKATIKICWNTAIVNTVEKKCIH
jgi:hypothetical protein